MPPEDGRATDRAHEFASVDELAPLTLMEGIRARAVHGERITLAVVELDAATRMPEHRHAQEQVGVVLQGDFTFTVGGETRVRRAGDMWVIPAGVPHTVESTGASGCVVIETFTPIRGDWDGLLSGAPAPGAWPGPVTRG